MECIKRHVLTVNYMNRSGFTLVYRSGVFLVLLFINDLPLALKNNIGLFFLMTRPFCASALTLAEVEEKIRPDIDAVSMWAKENKMKSSQQRQSTV